MGGLLVRQLLISYPDIAKNTQMLYLASTPFAGSQLARAAKLLTSNPQIQQLLNQQKIHDWADEQNSQWLESATLHSIPAYVAYEKEDMYSLRVVDEASADRGANRPARAIEADHIGICKPADINSPIYVYFKNAYIDTCAKLCNQAVKRWPTEDECRRLILETYGSTEAKILKSGHAGKISKDDIALTIENQSRLELGIVLCNAPSLFRKPPKLDSPFLAIPIGSDFGRTSKKLFSRINMPTGWFLVFVRYRGTDGRITDHPVGLFDFFKSEDPYISIARTVGDDVPVSVSVKEHAPEISTSE